MKWKCAVGFVAILSLISFKSFTQNNGFNFIPSSSIAITCNKTTNLIFPFTVQSIDRGSKDILVQQPKGTENIVQLKADKPNFEQTNLSVITVDGNLYSFTVDYAVQPLQLNIIVNNKNQPVTDSLKPAVVALTKGNSEVSFEAVAEKIEAGKTRHIKKRSLNNLQLRVNGIYVYNDDIYIKLQLKNKSNISYEIDNIRFSIKDQQQSKRMATQEIEIKPLFVDHEMEKVEADSIASFIIALPKFTLSENKYLAVQLFEKNGDRNINLALHNRHIMRAITIE
jgi:conjugative transposon TraN protein